MHSDVARSRLVPPSVRYRAGLGGFSLARPRPYTGPGGYVSGNHRPAPIRGPPALIPWTGPRLLTTIFNADPSGVWVGPGPDRGQVQGMRTKIPRPRPLSAAGCGQWPGAGIFRGPVRPVTNSSPALTHQQKKSVCVICISVHPASSGCVLWDNFFEVMYAKNPFHFKINLTIT